MDNLRLILIICGGAIILGIYLWETHRRRSRSSHVDELMGEDAEDALDDAVLDKRGPGGAVEAAAPVTTDVDERLEAHDLAGIVPDRDAGPVTDMDGFKFHDDGEPSMGAFTEMGRRGEELILVMGIRAPRGREFSGEELQRAFDNVGMRYGDMGIFHHHGAGRTTAGRALFSAASMVEPGTLDIAQSEAFSTPGLVLFTRLHGDKEDMEIFEAMLASGRRLAELLDGELQDEKRSSLSSQAVTHMRERIAEFRRRQLLNSQ